MVEKMTYADKPWLKSYKLGPYKLKETLEPYPKVPLFKILDDSAAKYPTKVACLALGKDSRQWSQTTYKELKLYADKLANALVNLGVKKGDRVVTVIPNCLQFIISDFGVIKTGAVHIPCSILHKAPDLEHEIESGGAETVICLEDNLPLINSIKDKTKLKNVIVTGWEDYSPGPPELKEIPGTIQFRRLLEEHEPKPPEVEIDPMEDLAFLCFTGGATGLPKGVMLTHYNRMVNLMQGVPWMLTPLAPGIVGKASVLIPVPLFHAYGHWVEHFAIYWGLRIILLPDPRDNPTLVQTMQEYRPFLSACVPTQYMRMVLSKVGRMQMMPMSCASPLPKEIADSIKAEIGMPVSESYGLTEIGPITHLNVSAFSKITGFMRFEKLSLGIPLPDTDVKIVDPGTGEEVPFGEEGEIWSRGPQLMKGYWPTAFGLEDGWLHTGDIGRMDEDGYFYLTDRSKDMINVSGYKVYSTQIDDVLFKHPAVRVAICVGIPDPKIPGSERIKAFINLKPGYEGKVTVDEIIEYCRDKVPPYAVPKFVEFRDEEFPLTVSEKPFKKVLRDEEIGKMKERGEIK